MNPFPLMNVNKAITVAANNTKNVNLAANNNGTAKIFLSFFTV